MKKYLLVLVVVMVVAAGARADMISIELTAGELGFADTNINYGGNGSAVEADRPGQLVTSTDNNVGSVLTIQASGDAGPGTGSDPLLLTVTARAHLDILSIPAGYDVYGGVITLTADNGSKDDGKKRGLGLRAFGIDLRETIDGDPNPDYGKRYVDDDYSDPLDPDYNVHGFQMEGSKEVSGGTNGTAWLDFVARNPEVPGNTPPHVDEDVTFNFNSSLFNVDAKSIEVILEEFKFDYDGRIALDIGFTNRSPLSFGELLTSDTSIFTEESSDLKRWKLDFDGLSGLGDNDVVDYFTIRALNDYTAFGVLDTSSTAEHFLINGFTAEVNLVPVPGALLLGMLGLSVVGMKLRKYA